jgi:hypothetical protein
VQDVEGRVVLEKEVPGEPDAANVFEDCRELEVFWVRAEAFEAGGMLVECY